MERVCIICMKTQANFKPPNTWGREGLWSKGSDHKVCEHWVSAPAEKHCKHWVLLKSSVEDKDEGSRGQLIYHQFPEKEGQEHLYH